jgi:hypothetical protein
VALCSEIEVFEVCSLRARLVLRDCVIINCDNLQSERGGLNWNHLYKGCGGCWCFTACLARYR